MLATIGSLILLPSVAAAAAESSKATPSIETLERIKLGDGKWIPASLESSSSLSSVMKTKPPPANFCTYATRFLICYDAGVGAWWASQKRYYSLLSDEECRKKLGRAFGSLAKSIEQAIQQLPTTATNNQVDMYSQLWDLFQAQYGDQPDAPRHLLLLFSFLPDFLQPVSKMQHFAIQKQPQTKQTTSSTKTNSRDSSSSSITELKDLMEQDFSFLLPKQFASVQQSQTSAFRIEPPVKLFEVGIGEEFGQTATATFFGPLALTPLTRDKPHYGWETYALFGFSGATGCALTHSLVIPLDVVKTRAQTDPDGFSNVLEGGQKIFREEGLAGLALGAQATLAGYFWYGLSVYPSYTFFKRFLAQSGVVLSPEIAMVHANDIALVAGALAAVVASLGLTPLEAARIRVVAEPTVYRPLGLAGTLSTIAGEDPVKGWKTLYDGLPSLLARQVIFGSVKFLAFERACEYIFGVAPSLRDATWTALSVSLVAGGFSGALSSVVSQPADSVLTYVAKNSDPDGSGSTSLGVLEGSRIMVEKEGISSLFRGLGSRCVWAGSIIAGQFLLYDVFRTYFGVSSAELSQVYRIVFPDSS